MSSFINTKNHFGSIYKSLLKLKNNPCKHRVVTNKLERCLEPFGKNYDERVLNITQTIMELQVTCVILQYEHRYSGKEKERILCSINDLSSFEDKGECLEYAALIKAIQCMLYQIETEHLKPLRKMTKNEALALRFFKGIEFSLLSYCMDNTVEYTSACWCIP